MFVDSILLQDMLDQTIWVQSLAVCVVRALHNILVWYRNMNLDATCRKM